MGSELRLYDVTVGSHQTRMRLDQADAEKYGTDAIPVTTTAPESPRMAAAPAPDTKSRLVTSNKIRGTDDPSATAHR